MILALLLAITPPSPKALVESAVTAMQRTASLRDVRSLRVAGIQHDFILGNAERAEGPWRVQYSVFSELHDLQSGAMRRTERGVGATGNLTTDRVTILADSVAGYYFNGRSTGASQAVFEDIIDRIDGSPIRALTLAAASPALKLEAPVRRFGLTYDVVSFPWRNGRMKIEISRETKLPDAVEIVRTYPDNFRWDVFSDVRMRADYVNWTIQPNGAWWPMQTKVSFNEQPMRDISLASVALETATPPADSFVVPDSARLQYAANSRLNFSKFRLGARGQPTELKPGIVRVPDQWAMTLVKQPDGVVIFEAHISGQYLRDVIGEANKRWPGAPIKAIVMTSDPWAHLGGLREAAAMKIPIYVNARSIPFLSSLVKPGAKFIPVSGKTALGKGDNRIELYPVGGAYAERMTMAYFPDHKLLYGADLVFMNRNPQTGQPTGGFLVTPAEDLRRAVTREGLAVDSVFCVQNYGPFAWSDFVK
jgi:glyoxylase-like metal-dependent hydrolase (beta-lactamase superfamily II)